MPQQYQVHFFQFVPSNYYCTVQFVPSSVSASYLCGVLRRLLGGSNTNKSVSASESVIAGCGQEDTGTFTCGVLPSEVVENRHNYIVLTQGSGLRAANRPRVKIDAHAQFVIGGANKNCVI